MKKNYLLLLLLSACFSVNAQVNPAGVKLDETQLALVTGTSVISDVTADGGNAIYRPATAGNNTMWFGPYMHLQGGNYLVQARLKVASNASGSFLMTFDVVSNGGTLRYNGLNIYPNMFRNTNEWQLFTIPVQLPDNVTNYELRGMSFQSGITDLYLDYINIIPGDVRGLYSNEFSITGTGNVGIGTTDNTNWQLATSPYKLAVGGAVIATGVTVKLQSSWPDFVFKPDYHIAPLNQLKIFIDKNHHLPEVPSEAEVVKNGVNLGEMNKLLVKKVEELTLYLIDKDNEIKKQQKVNEEQQRQLTVQQAAILSLQKQVDQLAKRIKY